MFSVGTLIQNEMGLSGISRLHVNFRLSPDLGNKLFIRKNDAITSITQDLGDTTNTNSKLILRILTPPSYVADQMFDPKTGLQNLIQFLFHCLIILVTILMLVNLKNPLNLVTMVRLCRVFHAPLSLL
jgi:hypothetical protein